MPAWMRALPFSNQLSPALADNVALSRRRRTVLQRPSSTPRDTHGKAVWLGLRYNGFSQPQAPPAGDKPEVGKQCYKKWADPRFRSTHGRGLLIILCYS